MFALDPRDGGDLRIEGIALARELLRLLRIVPEFRRFGEDVQFCKALLGLVPVKDASSAIRRIA
jgi:hypothetical protein